MGGADCDLWLYLTTATWDTPVAKAALAATRERLGPCPLGAIEVQPPQGQPPATSRTEDIHDRNLPSNFYDQPWERQAIDCILYIRRWAEEWQQSAVVLVILPGDKEIRKLESFWFQTKGHKDWVLLNVTSATPKKKCQMIRRKL